MKQSEILPGPAGNARPSIRVLHVTTFLSTTGGVEKLLRMHLSEDERHGVESRAIILFETTDAVERYQHATGLGLSGLSTIATAQRRFASRIGDWNPDVVIYHDGWGLPLFYSLDRAARRALILHCPSPHYLALANNCNWLLDGLLSVSPAVAQKWAESPTLKGHHIGWLPLPINAPSGMRGCKTSLPGRPIVICYCGRLEEGCKRADRMPELVAELDRMEMNYRFHVLGTGPLAPSLMRRFQGHPKVCFHGFVTGQPYWDILGGCDVIVSFSDVEGMGMSVLDAMSLGVMPYYPKIGGGAEAYVQSLGGGFLYPPGIVKAIATDLSNLTNADHFKIETIRQRCRELVRDHTQINYRKTYSNFLNEILGNARRHSRHTQVNIPFLPRHLPIGLVRRAFPSLLLKPQSRPGVD